MSKIKEMDTLGINEKLMRIRQNANSYLLLQMKGDQNVQNEENSTVSLGFRVLETKRELLLSRFMVVQTVDSPRSKKQS